jgi:hypothetical protein
MLRPTVSLPDCLGVKHPSGVPVQILYYSQITTGLFMLGVLSDKRTGLSFTLGGGPVDAVYNVSARTA